MTTPEDVQRMIEDNDVVVVDVKFTDLLGAWQHFSVTRREWSDDVYTEGLGFDGSSISGFQSIERSDMILIPDPATAVMDPFTKHPTLSITAEVNDPLTGDGYHKDARSVARRAEEYLKLTGVADESFWGPEPEFFILDSVRYDSERDSAFYYIDSEEAAWNTGKDEGPGKPNLGYKTEHKEGYFPVPPRDTLQDLRTEMVLVMQQVGIEVEIHHHEVATAGQSEIDMRFSPLVKMADNVQWYKHVVRNVARNAGKAATFMPKPVFEDNGNGMHVHQSLWKDGTNLFFDADGYGMISEMARHYIGGLIKHGPALMAFCAPTTNSYKRLVPGYEAPNVLVYSARNRSAGVRIPMLSSNPRTKRIEFRSPDPTCNPYLGFAALLMAGLDGIANRIDPGDPVDNVDLFEIDPREHGYPVIPGSLGEVLDALEQDHEFLLRGEVFDEDLIRTWIDYKRVNEVAEVGIRPHPHEFSLYFDA